MVFPFFEVFGALISRPMFPIMTFDLPPQAIFCASNVYVRRKPNLTASFPDETTQQKVNASESLPTQ
jgi:hypothetical protein